MIRVEIEDYCQQCLDFSPDVTKPDRLRLSDKSEIYFSDTVIHCQYRRRCAGIKRYLEQQMKNENIKE